MLYVSRCVGTRSAGAHTTVEFTRCCAYRRPGWNWKWKSERTVLLPQQLSTFLVFCVLHLACELRERLRYLAFGQRLPAWLDSNAATPAKFAHVDECDRITADRKLGKRSSLILSHSSRCANLASVAAFESSQAGKLWPSAKFLSWQTMHAHRLAKPWPACVQR